MYFNLRLVTNYTVLEGSCAILIIQRARWLSCSFFIFLTGLLKIMQIIVVWAKMTRKIVFTVNLREVKRFSEYFSVRAARQRQNIFVFTRQSCRRLPPVPLSFPLILTHFALNTVRLRKQTAAQNHHRSADQMSQRSQVSSGSCVRIWKCYWPTNYYRERDATTFWPRLPVGSPSAFRPLALRPCDLCPSHSDNPNPFWPASAFHGWASETLNSNLL